MGWFESATSSVSDWVPAALLAAKGDTKISVVIPARNEQATIGSIVTGIRQALIDTIPLVDELVVMDSVSTDATASIAADAGAMVHSVRVAGKGEALWNSLFVTTGDLLVFIDADLTEWGPHFVTGLLGPLLTNPTVQLVKGFYDRVRDDGDGNVSLEGGRVTELTARPILSLYWPELAAVIQPLSGEWAVRRSAFEAIPVPVGYGVEIATLLEVWSMAGLDAIAQVDLGRRAHTHQNVHDLAVMSAEILATAMRRAGGPFDDRAPVNLWQFLRDAEPPWRIRPVPTAERPPALGTEGYGRR
jgi:glucosyl-3-phosphoglycerate synthase